MHELALHFGSKNLYSLSCNLDMAEVKCPRCGSRDVESYGTILIEFGKWKCGAKEYKCNDCGRYFWVESR